MAVVATKGAALADATARKRTFELVSCSNLQQRGEPLGARDRVQASVWSGDARGLLSAGVRRVEARRDEGDFVFAHKFEAVTPYKVAPTAKGDPSFEAMYLRLTAELDGDICNYRYRLVEKCVGGKAHEVHLLDSPYTATCSGGGRAFRPADPTCIIRDIRC